MKLGRDVAWTFWAYVQQPQPVHDPDLQDVREWLITGRGREDLETLDAAPLLDGICMRTARLRSNMTL